MAGIFPLRIETHSHPPLGIVIWGQLSRCAVSLGATCRKDQQTKQKDTFPNMRQQQLLCRCPWFPIPHPKVITWLKVESQDLMWIRSWWCTQLFDVLLRVIELRGCISFTAKLQILQLRFTDMEQYGKTTPFWWGSFLILLDSRLISCLKQWRSVHCTFSAQERGILNTSNAWGSDTCRSVRQQLVWVPLVCLLAGKARKLFGSFK